MTSELQKRAKTLRDALERLRIKQIEFAAITGRTDAQIGRMCRGERRIPEYIWAFLLMLKFIDDNHPRWVREHIKRAREMLKDREISMLRAKLREHD